MRAFTLIELIVVILILGILAAISVIGYSQITERAQSARATADLRQVATAVLADATLHERADLTRTDVLAVMAEASGAEVSPDLTAAAWELGSFDDVPARPGQFALGFDDRDHAVVGDGGKRAALVTASGDGKVFAVVLTSNLDTGATVVQAPAGTTPAIVLGAIPDGGSVPVFSGGDTALPPLPTPPVVPTPEPTPEEPPVVEALALQYPNSAFTYGRQSESLTPTTNATGPVTFKALGTLPVGFTFDQATGALTSPNAWSVGVESASGGTSHVLALATDGKVWSWGYGHYGQLGRNYPGVGSTSNAVPAPVETAGTSMDGKQVIAVAAGDRHSLALTSDGRVHAWGEKSEGRLGTGTTGGRAVDVTGTPMAGANIIAIAAGEQHSVALADDGAVYTWGYNAHGQLGNGTTTNATKPVRVDAGPQSSLDGKRVVAIAAGRFSTLALAEDGTVHAWGWNDSGRLGDGTTANKSRPVAVKVTGTSLEGKKVTAIVTGTQHSTALTSDGRVHTWGDNIYGNLGTGSTVDSSVPTAVSNAGGIEDANIVEVAAGSGFTLAKAADGAIYSWGNNSNKQLGRTVAGNAQQIPGRVTDPALVDVQIASVTTGGTTSYVVAAHGEMFAWGAGSFGQIGNGAVGNAPTGVAVSGYTPAAKFPFTLKVAATETATGRTASFSQVFTLLR